MTQFCVEEAVFERLHFTEMLERTDRVDVQEPDPMAAARDFAAGRS